MKKSSRKSLTTIGALLAVLLALGGLATWDEWKTKQEKSDEKSKNRIADVAAADVVQVDYADTAADLSVTLVKTDGTWRLTRPVDALADQGAVENLISTLADYSYAKVVAEGHDKWAEYGAEKPERVVTIKTGGDKPFERTVYIGQKAPIGFSVYFRMNGDEKVYMGSQHLLTATSKTLLELRDKRFATIEERKVKSLTYTFKGAPTIEMHRDAGAWKITRPAEYAADADEIAALIDELSSVRVASFEEPPSAELQAAFADPAITITWASETGEASTAVFAQVGERVYGAFDPKARVFGLPDEVKSKLEKGLKDFRNRRVLQIDALDVAKVTVDGDTYENVDGSWYAAADKEKLKDKDKPAEAAHVRALIVDLEFARTDEFIPLDDPTATGLSSTPPEHRIQLGFKDTARPVVTLELFPAPGTGAKDKFLVRRSDAANVYRVSKSAFASMKPGATPATPASDEEPPFPEGGDEDGLDFDLGLPDEPATEKPPTG